MPWLPCYSERRVIVLASPLGRIVERHQHELFLPLHGDERVIDPRGRYRFESLMQTGDPHPVVELTSRLFETGAANVLHQA